MNKPKVSKLMPRKQTIPCFTIATTIEAMAKQASQYEYDGELLQDDWEEMTIEDLLNWMGENMEGKAIVAEVVK